MLILPIDCVINYVTGLNVTLKRISSISLTKSQYIWLTAVLMGLIVAGSFNWAAFSRRSLGEFFEKFKILMEQSLSNRKSSKHLAGRDLGRLEPTPSLKYQKTA